MNVPPAFGIALSAFVPCADVAYALLAVYAAEPSPFTAILSVALPSTVSFNVPLFVPDASVTDPILLSAVLCAVAAAVLAVFARS